MWFIVNTKMALSYPLLILYVYIKGLNVRRLSRSVGIFAD